MKKTFTLAAMGAILLGMTMTAPAQTVCNNCQPTDSVAQKPYVVQFYDAAKQGTINAYDTVANGTVKIYDKAADGTVNAYDTVASGTENVANKVADGTVNAYDKTKEGTIKAANAVKNEFNKIF